MVQMEQKQNPDRSIILNKHKNATHRTRVTEAKIDQNTT